MHKNNPLAAAKFTKLVLNWFDKHGRKTLPWQQNKTPYRVWISEIMLQQTQVRTVIPYFQRFMDKFADIQSLACAPQDAVLHLWTGLGYYSRARNLHKTAILLMENFNGQFPDNLEDLESLPGIGRSTAGAILALGFEKKAAILDGNVKRVLCRFHGILTWPGEKKTHNQLWDIAEKYTPTKRVADYTQAMMDLGATICARGTPSCDVCPLQKHCAAHIQGIEKTLPKKKPTTIIPTRYATFLILQKNAGVVLLQKRPPTGIWGGLWSVPEISGHVLQAEVESFCHNQQFHVKTIYYGEIFRHTFSHFHLEILPVFVNIKPRAKKIRESDTQIWYNLLQPEAIGLPAPVKTLLTFAETL